MNNSNFLVFACYLPPINSSRGRDAPRFFALLLAQIYLNDECDAIMLTGYFNSRIGSLPDTLNDIDCVPMRNTIDKSINQHGHEFIDFLSASKYCVLSGRFQGCDNLTSISTRGKSVVDYICDPHDVFDKCKKRTVAVEIETISSKNPTDFWKKVRKLGPRSYKCIPQEVVDDNGNITRSEQEVLERWSCDFENLYNGMSSDEFDSEHYIQAKVHKTILEENMEDPLYVYMMTESRNKRKKGNSSGRESNCYENKQYKVDQSELKDKDYEQSGSI
ncbi:unnamed protein product [Mytilus coruscus]|uniref:Uncharacterized protein n=1 Tax=Mytilus coruscus TaxID=42192 RepID=A0A6J8ACV0_MYTCO|nr:unnamed protein product [Mytilus coruscus]